MVEYHKINRYGLPIYLSQNNLSKDHQQQINKFIANVDAYSKALIPAIRATGIIENMETAFLDHCEVIIADPNELLVRGYFQPSGTIVIREEDKMLAVFGHEMVRMLLYNNGHQVESFQPSSDWSGPVGELWNIAESLSLTF